MRHTVASKHIVKELLQEPAENNRATKPQSQSLLDGLQDLDRMIDVKYKRAESLSRKLLLQSLRLDAVSSERASGRKQATAQPVFRKHSRHRAGAPAILRLISIRPVCSARSLRNRLIRSTKKRSNQ
ncbi:hypothetical protein MHYP_G00119760 [Metynnis hypsauchen]